MWNTTGFSKNSSTLLVCILDDDIGSEDRSNHDAQYCSGLPQALPCHSVGICSGRSVKV